MKGTYHNTTGNDSSFKDLDSVHEIGCLNREQLAETIVSVTENVFDTTDDMCSNRIKIGYKGNEYNEMSMDKGRCNFGTRHGLLDHNTFIEHFNVTFSEATINVIHEMDLSKLSMGYESSDKCTLNMHLNDNCNRIVSETFMDGRNMKSILNVNNARDGQLTFEPISFYSLGDYEYYIEMQEVSTGLCVNIRNLHLNRLWIRGGATSWLAGARDPLRKKNNFKKNPSS